MFTISSNFRRDVTIIEKNSHCSVYIDFSKNGINRLSYISKSPHARLHVGFYKTFLFRSVHTVTSITKTWDDVTFFV